MRPSLSLAVAVAFALPATAVGAQRRPDATPPRGEENVLATSARRGPRALQGDTVLVVANPVRADRRADFDGFVETFWSAGRKADPRGYQHVRVLRPVEANPDGTFTYLFVFDPALPGGDPSLEAALRKLFPVSEAERLLRLFEGSLAGQQTAWRVVQSRF